MRAITAPFGAGRKFIMKIIVTGASRGIGRGIATYLGEEGHTLGLLARSFSLLEEVGREIHGEGGSCCVAKCDIRDEPEVREAIAHLVNEMEGVDALINNAGIVIRKDVFTLTLDEWHEMVETNIHGPFYATRAVLPYLREQGRGHIINISSISGRLPLAGGSGYAATKYALTGFSQSLFHEVRDYGIKVTTIYPGSVDSASHRHDPRADHSWKVTPQEVGRTCNHVLQTEAGTLISEVEIRPLNRPDPP